MIKYKITIVLVLLFSLSIFSSWGQGYQLEGTVYDPISGSALSGAVITITGLSESVKTDEMGRFSVQMPKLQGVVETWFPGYYTDRQAIAGRNTIKIQLISTKTTGYTNEFVKPFLGLSSISEKLTTLTPLQKSNFNPAAVEVENVFQNIPGLQLIGKSGMPGEGSFFAIRGINSLSSNTTPLIVVNGVPYMPDMNESGIVGGFSKSALNAFHPADISNVTVLKGADAALYGSLGSNGVIMIETDKAVDLDTKVELRSQWGVDYNQAQMPVMGVEDYKGYVGNVALSRYEDMAQVLELFPYLVDNPDYFYNYLYNNQSDWQSFIYAPAMTTDNVLKIKGGDAIAKYDLSLGMKNKEGQVKNTGYSKYFARLNSDVNLSRKISMFSSISMSYLDYKLQEQGMLDATNPMLAAMKKAPLFSPWQKDKDNHLLPDFAVIRDEDNNLIVNNMVSNPLAVVNDLTAKQHDYDVQIRAGLNYKVNDKLNVRALGGVYYSMSRQDVFVPGITNRTIMPLNNLLAINTVRSAEGSCLNQYYQLGADYATFIDKIHQLKVSVNSQIAKNYTEYDAGTGYNTANDFYKTLNNVTSSSRQYFGYLDAWNWMNYNAHVQYGYNDKVFMGLGIAADASSSTGVDAPLFALYPSVNFNWKVLNQKDKLSLRIEYFNTGNSRFSSSLSKYVYVNKVFRELSGLVRAGIPNTEIRPEISSTLNLGVDLVAVNNRLRLSATAYATRNHDLIMPVSVSSSFGVNYLYDNVGETSNSGFEFGAQFALIESQNLQWYVGTSISSNIDKVISLGGQDQMVLEMEDGAAIRTKVNEGIYEFYGYQSLGVFTSSEEVKNAYVNEKPLQTSSGMAFQAGDIHFVDQNADGLIDDRDRVNLGSSAPDFFGNFNTHLSVKNWWISANFNYSIGNKMYNAVRRNMESMTDFSNQLISVNRRWSYEGQKTDIPRASYGDPLGNNRFSDRWIEDASFLKLKEITLGYQLEKVFNGAELYISGENLLTWTNYLGMDPETMYSYDVSLRGFDYAKIPLPRSYKIGFRIEF